MKIAGEVPGPWNEYTDGHNTVFRGTDTHAVENPR